MKVVDLLSKNKNLSQYSLAFAILEHLDELKEDPVIRATIEKAKELSKLRKVLEPGEYFMLVHALCIVETELAKS